MKNIRLKFYNYLDILGIYTYLYLNIKACLLQKQKLSSILRNILNNLCAPGTFKIDGSLPFARASHLQTAGNDMECTMMLFVEVTYFHYS